LLWRLFGVFVNQIFLLLHSWTKSVAALAELPLSFHLTHLCGALLVVLGPRLWLLTGMALSAGTWVGFHVIPDPYYQLAEEFLPLVVVPAVGALLAFLGRRASAEWNETAQVSLVRTSVLLVMGFAAFHKLNADFFDPEVSCAMIVPDRLLAALPFEEFARRLVPFAGFFGEALVPVLLIVWPRVGMPFALAIMTVIGHRGATPFTMLVIVMSLSFLRDGDRQAIAEGWRRFWPWLAGAALLAAVASFGVYRSFGANRPWREFLTFELVILGVGFTLLWTVLPAIRRGAWKDWRTPGYRHDPIWCPDPAVRAVLAVLVVVGFVNGMTPYLGAKFRMSFAMFSNLRVDDERWNHLVVPRALFVPRSDSYVHVDEVSGHTGPGRGTPGAVALKPSVLTSAGLDRRLLEMRRRGQDADVTFRYRGQTFVFEQAAGSAELARWIREVPAASRLLQDGLTRGRPQPCLH